ncbi:MAG: HPr(Ser) kinase/phosphatase [Myxococcota bacterium]
MSSRRIQKPGLAIAGFVESIRSQHIQILGETETRYLSSLDESAELQAVEGLLTAGIACIVMANGRYPSLGMRHAAETHSVPIFVSELSSGPLITRLHNFLDEHLSPEISLHGVLMDVFGIGMLLVGPSGIGKSECALDLILRGHRLVADDIVLVKQRGRQLSGHGTSVTRHHMEVRGLGIINVKDLFGAASVREQKQIELIVELNEWQPDVEYDRTGLKRDTECILDVEIRRIKLPIRPGRNVASIVEVAARNHLLTLQGHDTALAFQARLDRRLASTPTHSETT